MMEEGRRLSWPAGAPSSYTHAPPGGGGGAGGPGGIGCSTPIAGVGAGGGPVVGPARRTKDGGAEKICGVCGDRAVGFNFDAVSCESCKAFFRRNAPKGLEYFKCPYDEKCKMNLSNRRFCKRCRLKKCLDIGMRREYILSDDEKIQKRLKIEENRSLREMEKQVLSMKVDEVSGSTQPAAAVSLSAEDTADIAELLAAYRRSLDVNTERDLPRDRANFSDLVNIAELSVRRVIAMAKQVAAFKALPQTDQIHLLKGGSIELLIIRSVITFDAEKQQFLDPSDAEETKAMNVEQLRAAETGTGLFDDHMKFVRSLVVDLKVDEVALILLLVISLFSPDRVGLVHRDLVARQQERYSEILRKYLLATRPSPSPAPPAAGGGSRGVGGGRGGAEGGGGGWEGAGEALSGRAVFPRLLMKLTDIRNLNEEHSQVLLKVDPGHIQPLMKEVLDLTDD